MPTTKTSLKGSRKLPVIKLDFDTGRFNLYKALLGIGILCNFNCFRPDAVANAYEVTTMEYREESYVESEEEREKGHEDTRHHNFECEKPDPHLGCDPRVDVAG